MNKPKIAKKPGIFNSISWQQILTVAGIAVCASSIYPSHVQAQPLVKPGNLLIAQSLGGIVRQIPLEEVPAPAISAAKTVTGANFNSARIELKADGSSIYVMRGKNQQGFEVEVQANSMGTISQVDEQIDSSSIPETAVKAFKKWAPNEQVISTWRSTRLGSFYYQFVIKDFWLEIADDGSKVIIYRKAINL
jgi:hypothetical protein